MSVFWRILIYIKRLCKMPAFVIALLLMPVIAYGIKNFTTLENKGITVGIYATGEVGKAVCEDLLGKDYVVKFEKYDSIEKMKEDVEFKTIECGYVFEDAFEEGYKKGDLPITEELSKTTFAIPVFPEIYEEERNYVIEKVLKALED